MNEISKISVGISVGDPNGIGIEIILKAFQDKSLFSFFTPIVFGHSESLEKESKRMGFKTSIFSLKHLKSPMHDQLNVFNSWSTPFKFKYGKEEKAAGAAALSSLYSATEALKSGSKSTSFHVAEPVVIPSGVIPSAFLSLIEYPNLPAPYKPPAASPDPEVLPNTSEF